MTTSIDELIYFSILDNIFINNISNIINNYNDFEIPEIVKKGQKLLTISSNMNIWCHTCRSHGIDKEYEHEIIQSCDCVGDMQTSWTVQGWNRYDSDSDDE